MKFFACFYCCFVIASAAKLKADLRAITGSRSMLRSSAHSHQTQQPEQLEKRMEDMTKTVQSLGRSRVARRLMKELYEARAKLCLQHGFKMHEAVPCDNFMQQACGYPNFIRERNGKGKRHAVSASVCRLYFRTKQPPLSKTDAEENTTWVEETLDDIGEFLFGSSEAAPNKTNKSTTKDGCQDQAWWKSQSGRDCSDYDEGDWCTPRGTPGDGWLDEWGGFEDYKKDGMTAKEACCACGGGITGNLNKEAHEAFEKGLHEQLGSAPGPAPGPAPGVMASPGPAPEIPAGLSASMAWEFNKNLRPLQVQGVSGELVEHEDGNTMTGDWLKEFGPKSGLRDLRAICSKHRGNEWCRLHGYFDDEKPKSSAAAHASLFLAAALVCFQGSW